MITNSKKNKMGKKIFICVATTRRFGEGIEGYSRKELKAFFSSAEAKAFKELTTFNKSGKISTECTVEVHEVEI